MKALRFATSALLALALSLLSAAPVAAQGNDCATTWVHSHSLELPPGFWSSGSHNYEIAGSESGVPFSFYREFLVTNAAPLIRGQAYLRFVGVATSQGPVTEINPAQDTVMQITFLYSDPVLARPQAEASRAATTVQMRWDGGSWISVAPGPLMKLCTFDNPGHFLRSWGPKF